MPGRALPDMSTAIPRTTPTCEGAGALAQAAIQAQIGTPRIQRAARVFMRLLLLELLGDLGAIPAGVGCDQNAYEHRTVARRGQHEVVDRARRELQGRSRTERGRRAQRLVALGDHGLRGRDVELDLSRRAIRGGRPLLLWTRLVVVRH